MSIINTRQDLDAITGTDEHKRFMQTLTGSLFTIRKDEVLKQWVAEESNELIEQLEFIRADFEPIELPVLPVYKEIDDSEQLRNEAMREGFDYNGYQVSVTSADGAGMLQVEGAFNRGVTDTVIHFENGTRLPMNSTDFPNFVSIFVTERNKFFI